MKILLSGALNPRFEALPEHLKGALEGLGHSVRMFDHRAFLLPGRARAVAPILDRLDRRRLNRRLLGIVERDRPDLLIVNQGMVLEGATIEAIRDRGTRAVNWFSDFPAEFEKGLRAAPFYDAFFLGSSFAANRHREAGHRNAAWLPFGCDARPAPDRDPGPRGEASAAGLPVGEDAPPIVFVGSHYPERQILLRFLRGLRVGIWGPGWERAADDPHVAPMLRGGALRPAAWRRVYAGCRVALNIHYGSFGPPDASGELANTRVFEILACGACQVVDRPGDVLRLFADGEHLLTFASGEELRARVEQALGDDALRERLARRGRAEVLARHTYAHRAARLIEGRALDFEARPHPTAARPGAMASRRAGGASGSEACGGAG